jgi:hypothetical protein
LETTTNRAMAMAMAMATATATATVRDRDRESREVRDKGRILDRWVNQINSWFSGMKARADQARIKARTRTRGNLDMLDKGAARPISPQFFISGRIGPTGGFRDSRRGWIRLWPESGQSSTRRAKAQFLIGRWVGSTAAFQTADEAGLGCGQNQNEDLGKFRGPG